MRKSILQITMVMALLLAILSGCGDKVPTPGLNFITEAVYEEFGECAEGFIWARDNTKVQYLDYEGNVVIDDALEKLREILGGEPNMDGVFIDDFHDGLALITYSAYDSDLGYDCIQQAYFLQTDGSLGPVFQDVAFWEVGSCVNGKILIIPEEEDAVYVYDKAGVKERTATIDCGPDRWGGIYWNLPGDGLIAYYSLSKTDSEDVLFGYLDENFQVAIPAQFEDVRPFNQGLAVIVKDDKCGFIDKTGTVVIEPLYEDFAVEDMAYSYRVFTDGYAAMKLDGRWGVIDKTGKQVVPFIHKDTAYLLFREGLAPVDYGYVDTTGEKVIQIKEAYLLLFVEGAAMVGSEGSFYFIDTAGEPITKKTWDFDAVGDDSSFADQNIIIYERDEKWGLAQVVWE